MRFVRDDVRGHIASPKNDHGPSYRRYRASQRLSCPKINICEIFGGVRFSTFATLSALRDILQHRLISSETADSEKLTGSRLLKRTRLVGQLATAAPDDMWSARHRTADDYTGEFFAEVPARLVDAHKRRRPLVGYIRSQFGRLEATAVLLWRFEPFSKQRAVGRLPSCPACAVTEKIRSSRSALTRPLCPRDTRAAT
jgi:hypothetical protein